MLVKIDGVLDSVGLVVDGVLESVGLVVDGRHGILM